MTPLYPSYPYSHESSNVEVFALNREMPVPFTTPARRFSVSKEQHTSLRNTSFPLLAQEPRKSSESNRR